MARGIRLERLDGDYGIARLEPAAPIPAWADGEGFVSISRSADELSILCLGARIPAGIRQDAGWACFRLVGPFAFDETGIVLSVIRPLSEAGLGIFVVSTFDGDHVLVKRGDAARAAALLTGAGHSVD